MSTINYILTEALVSNEAEEITKALFDKIKNKTVEELYQSGYLKKYKATDTYKNKPSSKNEKNVNYLYVRDISEPFNDYMEEKLKDKNMEYNKKKIYLSIFPAINGRRADETKYGNTIGEGNSITIKIYLNSDKINSSIRRVLFHEIVHVIDYLRTNFKQKNKSKYIKQAGGDQEYAYLLDTFEKNAIINTLASFKKKYPKRWKDIYTFSDLLSKMSFSFIKQYRKYKDRLLSDPNFYKPFLKRLYREDLIPEKMRVALSSNMTLKQIENAKSWDEIVRIGKKLR